LAAIEPQVMTLDSRMERADGHVPAADPFSSERTVIGSPWEMTVKRVMDILVSLVVLVLLAPLLLLVALAIRVTSPGPVLYRQTRVGRYGKQFTLLKFRTMVDGAHEMLDQVTHLNSATGPLFKAHGDPRLTPVGRLLRRCFLDEMPQLVNVLFGEMSLVGPRPCLLAESAQMHQFRFDAPQGVTGPWQVNGHHALTWEELAEVELGYVRHWSLASDFAILLRTVSLVIRLRGM
jgi:lipopolysaccharide/colanic/teichoic acid biosynthesis glycosyltransferase